MTRARTEGIVEYVKKHPGCTSVEISRGLDLPEEDLSVSARLTQAVRRKYPEVRREVKEMTISNRPVYAYFPISKEEQKRHAEATPRKQIERRKKTAVAPAQHPLIAPATAPIKEPELTNKQAQLSGSLDTMVDSLALAFAGAVAERIKQLIPQAVAQQVLPAVTTAELASRLISGPEKEPAKKRVLVAGLLPAQAGIISNEFGDVFDLDFYMTGENLNQLRKKLQGRVDYFFTFTSKIEHATEHLAKSLGVEIHRCSGGMTMLKDQLLKLYAEEA